MQPLSIILNGDAYTAPIGELMQHYPELFKQAQALDDTLEELGAGEHYSLDYTVANGGEFDVVLRIKAIATLAGVQFAIKQVTWRGEGSGDYHPLSQIIQCRNAAFRSMVHYNRETPLRNKINELYEKQGKAPPSKDNLVWRAVK